MNDKLRKAIEDATKVYPWPVPMSMGGGDVLDVNSHHASQAKLLRVIELLVQRRNEWIEHIDLLVNSHRQHERINSQDAELIAALKDNG